MNPREIDRDEDLFFRIIQTMPSEIEAVDLLRRAREWVLNEKDEAGSLQRAQQLLRAEIERLEGGDAAGDDGLEAA